MKNIRFFLLRHISFICAFLMINGLVLLYYQNTVNKIGGTYVYPLDDTYIHLAVAKNIALHNTFGVTRHEFSSSSSSPLYVFLLGILIKLFGDNAIYPLLVNIFFGNLVILILYAFIKEKKWFLVLTIVLCNPILLHIQILSGMEHTMHVFLILAAFILFSRLLDNDFANKKERILFLFVISLLCLTRYESMFFIAPILFILLLNRRYFLLLATFIAGFLPVLLFGLWSINQGGFFFPNSLLLKGDINPSGGVFRIILHYLQKFYDMKSGVFIDVMGPILIICIIIVQWFFINKNYSLNGFINLVKRHALAFITCTTVFFHVLFASFGWLFRYEAYLLTLLYLTLYILIYRNIDIVKNGIRIAAFVITFIMILPGIAARMYGSHRTIVQAGKNIYDQQIQMSRFLNVYYNDAYVIANDIGAITYFTDIKLKDTVGLGSNDIASMRRRAIGWRGLSTILQKYDQYNMIIIYDSRHGINSNADYEYLGLIKIAELWIVNNVIAANNRVSFYTSDETMAEEMRMNMLHFKESVPAEVTIIVF